MSLYERLGRFQAITAVVQKFYQIMLQDPRVAHYFANTDMEKQRSRQVAFITLVTGGPNLYQGANMKAAHCKHSIGHFEFDAAWENLQQALNFFNVPKQQVSELKEIFYSVESQIVKQSETTGKTPQKTPQAQKQVERQCPFHYKQQKSKVPQKKCTKNQNPVDEKKEDKSLYDRLGGHVAVQLVVNKFYDIMLEDPRVKAYFANTNMEKQRLSQIEFISMVTGGPNNYAGKDMKATHCPYKIGHPQFDATWQNLQKAFDYFKANSVLVNEVKEIFYSVEGEIVNSSDIQVLKEEQNKRAQQIPQKKEQYITKNWQGIVTLTQALTIPQKECPAKIVRQNQYEEAQVMKCSHMAIKLKEIELNVQKLSECDKRKLRQEIMEKQEGNKELKKLSNNPYQRTYY